MSDERRAIIVLRTCWGQIVLRPPSKGPFRKLFPRTTVPNESDAAAQGIRLINSQLEVSCTNCGAWNPTKIVLRGASTFIGNSLTLGPCVSCGVRVKVKGLRWPPNE